MTQDEMLNSIKLGKAIDLHTLLDKGIYGLPADASFINGPDFTDDATISVTPIYRGDGTTAIIHELTSSAGDKYVEIGELSTKTWSDWTAIGGGGSGGKGPKGDTGLGYANFSSTTSWLLNVGSVTFTTNQASNKTAYTIGNYIKLASAANPTKNYAEGYISAFSGTDLTVLITNVSGSGTFADWIISIAGEQGQAGKDGKDGTNGKDGAQGSKGDQGIQGASGKDGAQGPAGKDGSAVMFNSQVVTELQFGSNVDASIKDGVLLIDAKSGGGGADPKSAAFECTALKVNNASTGLITWQGLSIPALLLAVNGEVPFVFNLDKQYNAGDSITLNIFTEVFNTDSSACNISNLGYSVAGFDAAATNHANGTTTLNIAANEFTSNRKILSIPITFKAACSSVQVFLNNFTGASAKKAGFTNTIRFSWS